MPGVEHVEVTGTGELSCDTPWLGNEATLKLNITLRIRSVRVDLVQIAAELGLPATQLLRELQWRAAPAAGVDRVDDVSDSEDEDEDQDEDQDDDELEEEVAQENSSDHHMRESSNDLVQEKVFISRSLGNKRAPEDEKASASTSPSKKQVPVPQKKGNEDVHNVEDDVVEVEPASKKICVNKAKESATSSSAMDTPVTSPSQEATPASASQAPPIAASTTPGSGLWSSLWSSKRD